MDLEQREFRADPVKLKRLRVAAGLTVQEFAKVTGLDRTTASKVLRGDPVFLKSLALAGSAAFGVNNPLELLHPEELHALGVQTDVPSPGRVLEWEIVAYLSGRERASNGLQYQRLQLRHRYLPQRFARARCYELRHLRAADQQRLDGHLRRHVEVCERVGHHDNIADNLTAAWVGGLWWVLDRWEEGLTLAERLDEGGLSPHALKLVMTGIALGLEALHAHEIIVRELSPRRILLREADDRPIVCDLELAKLTDRRPTAAPEEWPDDPWRALEVGSETPVDVRADLYSWGRIFVQAATGTLPERGAEDLSQVRLPEGVRQLVRQCVSLPRSQRPNNVKSLLTALKKW